MAGSFAGIRVRVVGMVVVVALAAGACGFNCIIFSIALPPRKRGPRGSILIMSEWSNVIRRYRPELIPEGCER